LSTFHLKINGQARSVEAGPDTPLLWILRDALKLPGTKYGCGVGQCGACTVHVAGSPARACLLPVAAVGGMEVTTIEGLDAEGRHPLQLAWCELDVPQCGYCQPGQLMTAAALLRNTPAPTESDIDEAMAGNLCRCGTYLRIRAGIKRAVELAAPKSPERA
jgi:isoquinoline 1-oxidoreductase alpha subunit